MQAFLRKSEDVLQTFSVHADAGLTNEQVLQSRESHGENTFTRAKKTPLIKRIWDAVCEPMVIMLVLADLIAFGVNVVRAFTGGEADFIECVGILVAIALSVVITVAMEGRSAKAFEALSKFNDEVHVKVIRDGKTQYITQKDVVVGDIVLLGTGDKLPADGRLIQATDLTTDESALTGESLPVKKDADAVMESEKTPVAERTNMLYSGCFITGGNGKMVITAVGDDTEFGKIAKELSGTEKASTPLQEKMASLGKKIAVLGVGVAAVVFLVQLFFAFLHGTANFNTISEAFITSIVLIVAAVPEGLPTIMAVSLAIHIIKMSRQNALVKKMVACETVGSINVICSDKTGTLTENRMTVTDVYAGGALCTPQTLQNTDLLENFCINSTADVGFEEKSPSFIGNPTECALLVAAKKAGKNYKEARAQAQIIHVFPFSSETKNMTTILEKDGCQIVYTKGSPEKILAMCTMEPAQRDEVQRLIQRFQENTSRVLAFAHKTMVGISEFADNRDRIESKMTFDGFVAIKDPLRRDVYEAVRRCANAGIDIKMLTGDNIVTASAIARELHILDDTHIAVEAKELENLSEQELVRALEKIRVIARSTPVIKMRVVNALKAQGNVVAVTGDGINDAPALKNADVGIAMGISGTEVSKEASDIVLLDDSFSTIVKAVQWGRGIYENFQRFIQFQLTVNLSSVLVVLTSVLAGLAAPFTALQLLWVNIIMDGPPALTLGLEPVRGSLMERRPVGRNASIVTRNMLGRILVNGLFISIVFMAQYFTNFLGAAPQQLSTVLFTLFVVFQLFNAFNSRELSNRSIFRSLGSNKLMLAVFALTFALQVVITQFGGVVFGTVPLPLSMWAKIVAVAFTVVLVSELVKLVWRLISRKKA
ncbi:MAG: calcium-translocating P-type ATPase, PMCA-type [Acutalibacteraceae bacterium]|nr:calcium-translocating P-type ATPase, PMCA-type [Acutalibacteraceae bacterium]HIR03822.1 calcium-translocating P-type ATPase, PMCA-type [Candidatus Scatovicinus merdipullorum]